MSTRTPLNQILYGPQGPRGFAGPAGPTGPTGPSGALASALTMPGLRALAVPTNGTEQFISGYWTTGDGGAGTFYYNSASTATDDGGTIIKPTAVGGGAGRWFRLLSGGEVNVKWFGAPMSLSTATSGTITAGTNLLTVASTTGMQVGMPVAVQAVGPAGSWLQATITNIAGSVVTLSTNASFTTVGPFTVVLDDYPAFRAAIDWFALATGDVNAGGDVLIPSGHSFLQYFLSRTLLIDRNVGLRGTGAGEFGTNIQVPTGSTALQCASRDDAPGRNISGIRIENIGLSGFGGSAVWSPGATGFYIGAIILPTTTHQNGFVYQISSIIGTGPMGAVEPIWPTTVGATVVDNNVTWKCIAPHGIAMYCATRVQNCFVSGFCNCIEIFGGVGGHGQGGDGPLSQTSLWYIENCFLTSALRHGLHVNGTDANAGVCIRTTADSCRYWGMFDESDLGNTYIQCHTQSNGDGPGVVDNAGGAYKMACPDGPSTLIGCYSEEGQNTGTQLVSSGGSCAFSGLISGLSPISVGTFFGNITFPRVIVVNENAPIAPGIQVAICGLFNANDVFTWKIGLEVLSLSRDILSDYSFANLWSFTHAGTASLCLPGDRYVDSDNRIVFPHGYQMSVNNGNPVFVSSDSAMLSNSLRRNRGDRFEDGTNTSNGAMGKFCIQAGQAHLPWQPSHAYTVGQFVGVQVLGAFYSYKCTTSGTSGSSQPTWLLTPTTDNTAVWSPSYTFYTAWQAGHVYAVGDVVVPTVRSGFTFECITAGTSAGGEPSWLAVAFGAQTADNTVLWQAKGWDWQCAKFIDYGKKFRTQSLAHSATPAFDSTLGDTIQIGPVTANITGPTITAGFPGQRLDLIFLKDGTGSTYTIAGWTTNVRFAGSLTMLAGASSLATLSFVWNDQLATPAWVEIARSLTS